MKIIQINTVIVKFDILNRENKRGTTLFLAQKSSYLCLLFITNAQTNEQSLNNNPLTSSKSITYLHKPGVHEVAQGVQPPFVQSVGTQPCSKEAVSHKLPEGTQPHVIYTVLYKHTWVNAEFLHQAEHLFGEHFGLHQVLAVLGQREAGEAAGRHGSTTSLNCIQRVDIPAQTHKHTC